jgi:HSP20 family molecular chaperone IbpA
MHNLEQLFWNSFAGVNQTSNYPPFNIIENGKNFLIEIGACGFSENELSVEYDGRTLEIIAAHPKTMKDERVYLQAGLAKRDFKQTIAVRGQFDIGDVILEHGILYINMIDKTERVRPKIEVRSTVSQITKK